MKKNRTFIICAIFATMVSLAVMQSGVMAQEMDTDDQKPGEQSKVVARVQDEELTMDELVEIIEMRGSRYVRGAPEQVRNMKKNQVREVVEDIVYMEQLSEEAEQESFSKDKKIQDRLDMLRSQILAGMVYETEVLEKVQDISEAEIRQYYMDYKEEKFKRPFSFNMRHIYLSTYKPYTTKEGDTLHDIAEKISGDREMVEYILVDDETKKERWVPEDKRDEEFFRPLEPGERLLAPMNEKEKKEVYEKIQKIHKDLKKGDADFAETAAEMSESGENSGNIIGPIVPSRDEKPMLPEILNAIKKTPEGEITDIVHTKHGYHIFQVVEKTEEGYNTLEEVKDNIIREMQINRRKELTDKTFMRIARNTPGIEIHPEVFTKDDRTSNSVIVSIGDEMKYTLGDFDNKIPPFVREKAETNEEKLEIVVMSREVILPLLSKYGKEKNLDEMEKFKEMFRQRKITLIGNEYLREQISKIPEPTEEEMKEYYTENKGEYKEPRKFDISLIGLQVSKPGQKLTDEEKQEKIKELKERLSEVKKEIDSREKFELKAREISEDPTKRRNGHVGKVTEGYREGFDGKLFEVKEGEISEPFAYGAFVYILRVNEIIPEKQRTFEEAKRTIESDISRKRRQEFQDEKKEKLLKKAGFEFVM